MAQREVKPVIIAAWPKYKRDHQRNPKQYPMTRAAFARALNISPSHLSKSDPDIRKIALEIDRISAGTQHAYAADLLDGSVQGTRSGRTSEADPSDYQDWLSAMETGTVSSLPDDLLQRQTDELIRRAIDSMARFTGQFSGTLRRREPVEDAPLALYELERTAERLLKLTSNLKPLVSERRRRDIAEIEAKRATEIAAPR